MSVQVGRIKWIPVKIHFTLVISFLLVPWTLAGAFMPEFVPGLTTLEYWAIGIVGAAVLFASTLLHELSHSMVAMSYGVKVRQIMLFVFGEVSDISEEMKDYRKEARMAFAGPLTSFVISAVFWLLYWLLIVQQVLPITGAAYLMVKGVLYYVVTINLFLGAFNLLPAFPSDGGRLLRAALMKRKRDYNSATRTAANVGIAISYSFMGLGFVAMLTGNFIAGLWIVLIGWFLMSGAQSYLSQIQLASVLATFRLRDIMNSNVISVRPGLVLDRLISDYFRKYMKSAFPVIDYTGRLEGMMTLKRALQVPEAKRQDITVVDVLMPVSDLPILGPEDDANAALMAMVAAGIGKVFVCDADGRLLGIVSKSDILGVEIERNEYTQAIKST
jgi:Zn-dependent protease/CBS domain-containing protein